MFNKMKNMLGLQEEIQRKTDGYARTDGTYFDKHDLDEDGKAKEKPFTHGSMRIAPLLNCSKLVREDDRVADIYTHIERSLEIGNRQLLDKFKQDMVGHAKDIAEQEIKARQRLQALEYYNTAVKIAGALIIVGKMKKELPKPKSTIVHLAYAVCHQFTTLVKEDHLLALPFVERSSFEETPEMFWTDFEKGIKIKYDDKIKTKNSQR